MALETRVHLREWRLEFMTPVVSRSLVEPSDWGETFIRFEVSSVCPKGKNVKGRDFWLYFHLIIYNRLFSSREFYRAVL
jgi:hypothetical protein